MSVEVRAGRVVSESEWLPGLMAREPTGKTSGRLVCLALCSLWRESHLTLSTAQDQAFLLHTRWLRHWEVSNLPKALRLASSTNSRTNSKPLPGSAVTDLLHPYQPSHSRRIAVSCQRATYPGVALQLSIMATPCDSPLPAALRSAHAPLTC